MARLYNISIRCLGTAQVPYIQGAVGIEVFSEAQGDGVAWLLAVEVYLQHADHVLAHVEDPSVTFFKNRNRRERVLDFDVWIWLRGEDACGSFDKLSYRPTSVIVTRSCPVTEVEILVVCLAVVFIGGADGSTVGDFP